MNQATLTFYSGVDSVTGANFMLEYNGTRVLVDCGLVQGSKEADELNREPFTYDPQTVDVLVVSHAHIDHIGRIPKLVRDGFRGKILSTGITKQIAEIMFEDALGIMGHKQRENGTPPLYEKNDAARALAQWEELGYHESRSLADGFTVQLKDAGHIIGSALIEFTLSGDSGTKKLVFADDLGNSPAPLLRDAEHITDATYLVMDSVYGNRTHEPTAERDEKFRQIVKESIERGGALVIPAFSLARTQIVLHELNHMVGEGVIPSVPVFLDSPLAIKLTEIYRRIVQPYNDEIRDDIESDDDPFSFPNLEFTERVPESKAIEGTPNPKIIIAGSGMSTGGRVLHHEIDYLPDPQSTLLLVGYQAVGTLGRRLEEGAQEVEIFDQTVPVRARIERIGGYSSHADQDQLLDFVAASAETLETVFLAMGEPKSSSVLAQCIRDELGVKAVCPEQGKQYKLEL
ncbi:MAG: MBL fold metallo-hydrolase [Candidatus Paceibacterota bacterium]